MDEAKTWMWILALLLGMLAIVCIAVVTYHYIDAVYAYDTCKTLLPKTNLGR